MPRHFTRPPFICYNGKMDLVGRISHFTQLMATYLCKVFPSSFGPTTMRWFNRLKKGPIHSFVELIQAFGARFVTCS